MIDEELGIMAEVASLYFEQGFSQQEIASKLYFSRSKVSRLLTKALEKNVVQITINYPLERVRNLEAQCKERFNLDDIIVIKNYNTTYELLLKRLGNAAAQFLDTKLKEGNSLGVTWGQTVYNVVDAMNPQVKKNLRVIQIMGTADHDNKAEYNSSELARMIVEKYGGTVSLIYSPLVVENDLVRDSLVKEPIISRVVEEAKQCDFVLSSLGEFTSRRIKAWESHLSENDFSGLEAKGAAGVLCAHIINSRGELVSEELDKKVIGIKLADLRKIKNVVAVVGGKKKATVLLGAIRGGYINSLIMDEELASVLLQKTNTRNKK